MNTQSNIIPVNLAPLEQEISEAEAAAAAAREQVSYLETIIAQKISIRDYILKLGEKNQAGWKNGGTASHNGHANEAIAIPAASGSDETGISAFIFRQLDGGNKTAKELTDAYVKLTGRPFEAVRNNISNALARQKDAGKVDRRFNKGERAADWFLIK